MFTIIYNKPFAIINGIEYELYEFAESAPNSVTILLRNEIYSWATSAISNETTINGVLQTSAQMIIDTLSNGQS
jgi:hypothetical protein